MIPNPVPSGTFSDTYGDPRSNGRRHAGVDIFAPQGSPVIAPVSGRVTVAGNDGGAGGNRVWIVGDDGRAYYFAHLAAISARVGDLVTVGRQIGTVGRTGNASGSSPHLHFSINGRVGNENPVVNPYQVINRAMRVSDGPISSPVGIQGPNGPVNSLDDVPDDNAGGLWGPGCLWKVGIGPIDGCVISRGNARALVGALIVAGGAGVLLAGAFLVVGKSATPMGALSAVAGKVRPAPVDEVAEARKAAQLAAARDKQEAAERRIVRRTERTVDRDDIDYPATPQRLASGETF